jgi:hypothetical protein
MQSQSNLSRRKAAAILVAMTMCLPAAFAAEKSFDRTLSVNGPVTLRVSTGSGYIRVSPGSDNQVHIVGHVKSSNNWWGGSSDDAVAKVAANPPIDQAGNIIRVGDDHGNDWARHVSIDYEITTPAHTMLVAESGSGDLQISNIDGTVKAHTGSGSIRADKLGSGSRLETGSGTIDANNLMGSTTLQTGWRSAGSPLHRGSWRRVRAKFRCGWATTLISRSMRKRARDRLNRIPRSP